MVDAPGRALAEPAIESPAEPRADSLGDAPAQPGPARVAAVANPLPV